MSFIFPGCGGPTLPMNVEEAQKQMFQLHV